VSSLKEQGVIAFLWDFSGKIIRRGMSFVVSIFLARLLVPEDFGLIALVVAIIAFSNIFTDVSLGAALIQRKRLRPVHYSSVFYFNLFMGTLFTLLIFFLAPIISNFYNNDTLIDLIKITSFSFIITSLVSVHGIKLRKELKYAVITKISLISSSISGIVGVLMAFYGFGIWSLVTQMMLSKILYAFLLFRASELSIVLEFSLKALKQLWAFGFRMFLANLLNTFYSQLNTIMIAKLFPMATLGYLQRAAALNGLAVQYSSGSLMAVLFPLLSKIQNDFERFQTIVIRGLGVISFAIFFLIGLLYLSSDNIIVLFYGEKWLPSSEYFKLMALSSFIYPVSALLVNVLSSRGNSKKFLRLEIYKKVLATGAFVVLYHYGITVYLYTLILTGSIAVYLNIYFVNKEIGLAKWMLIKIILIQAIIAIIGINIVLLVNKSLLFGDFMMIIINSIVYMLIFIGINKIFKTKSYSDIAKELNPIKEKILKKVFKNKFM